MKPVFGRATGAHVTGCVSVRVALAMHILRCVSLQVHKAALVQHLVLMRLDICWGAVTKL